MEDATIQAIFDEAAALNADGEKEISAPGAAGLLVLLDSSRLSSILNDIEHSVGGAESPMLRFAITSTFACILLSRRGHQLGGVVASLGSVCRFCWSAVCQAWVCWSAICILQIYN